MRLKQRLFAAEKLLHPSKLPPAIAFLDTGISPAADFTEPQNRIIAFLDLVNGKTLPYDDNGHGTHLTGSIFCKIPAFREKSPLFPTKSGIV